MIQEITPTIQDRLNLSALILKKNYPKANISSWFGFNINNDLEVKHVKRLLKLHGVKSGLHLRNALQRYENGEIASNSFEKLAAEFRTDTTSRFDAKCNAQENFRIKNTYKIVWKHRFNLKQEKLLGYEMAYSIFLMRLGGVLGFISTEEMELRLEDINERVKTTFTSWGEFHRNVCLGDEFILGVAEPDTSIFPVSDTIWGCYQRLNIEHADRFKEWKL
ncbi:DUF1266 domain-containing protein [Formosa sp. L2A11]|uniref:DUF1266 domain-containing protein n=1 Tax=Formosa sp. L2A11 TaxID=2686363 RepID=UPI00131CFFF6|nr:DUF1266 domain-containing protein [Formosa sp. L2A11]